MKKLLGCSALALALALPFMASNAQAGSCSNAIRNAQKQIFKDVGDVCAQVIDTSAKENSPFVYVNPDGGCDLGLELPGLPSFGLGMGTGFDMCGLAKTITGGMVNQANSVMRDTMNKTVNGINQTAQESLGTGVVNNNVNISDLLNKQAQGAALQTPGYVQ